VIPTPTIPPVTGIDLSTMALLQIPDSSGCNYQPNTLASPFSSHPDGH